MNLDLPIVNLVCSGRTGSLFLHSLFENHQEVLNIPSVFDYQKFYKNYSFLDNEKIVDVLLRDYPFLLNSSIKTELRYEKLGLNQNEYIILDESKFRERMKYHLGDEVHTFKTLLFAIHYSINDLLGRDTSKVKLLLFHIHRIQRAINMANQLPNTKIISITRDPRAAMMSYYRNYSKFQGCYDINLLYRGWERILEGFSEVYYSQKKVKYPYEYAVVKMEDVHLHQKEILLKVCDYFGISYSDKLLETTFYGKIWWGDILGARLLTGFAKKPYKKSFEGDFDPKDLNLLDTLFYSRLKNFGYQIHGKKMGLISMIFSLFFSELKVEKEYRLGRFTLDSINPKKPSRYNFLYFIRRLKFRWKVLKLYFKTQKYNGHENLISL